MLIANFWVTKNNLIFLRKTCDDEGFGQVFFRPFKGLVDPDRRVLHGRGRSQRPGSDDNDSVAGNMRKHGSLDATGNGACRTLN